MVSDPNGKYSFCGRAPRTHVLKVDPRSLPKGSVLAPSSNRNAADPGSLFLDLKHGELHRSDFILACKPAPSVAPSEMSSSEPQAGVPRPGSRGEDKDSKDFQK